MWFLWKDYSDILGKTTWSRYDLFMILERYNRPIFFYSLSLVIPWILWFIVAYLSHHQELTGMMKLIQSALGILGLVSPLFVACYLFLKDPIIAKDILSRLLSFPKFPFQYTMITVLLIPASIILAQFISVLFGYGIEQFVVTGKPSFTSSFLPVWFILIFAPIVEELAWHSYGTDTLRRQFNLFLTSTIFAVYWVIWHLPLAFIKGYYQSNVVAVGPLHSINFMFSLFVFVILMNWLYFKTHRNILISVIFHLTANVSNEIFATHPDSKIIQTGLLCIVCIYILLTEKDLFFSNKFRA